MLWRSSRKNAISQPSGVPARVTSASPAHGTQRRTVPDRARLSVMWVARRSTSRCSTSQASWARRVRVPTQRVRHHFFPHTPLCHSHRPQIPRMGKPSIRFELPHAESNNAIANWRFASERKSGGANRTSDFATQEKPEHHPPALHKGPAINGSACGAVCRRCRGCPNQIA
jgi:hypothetical protein